MFALGCWPISRSSQNFIFLVLFEPFINQTTALADAPLRTYAARSAEAYPVSICIIVLALYLPTHDEAKMV